MKKFFEKKVRDYKFRGAGQGHRLDEEKQKAQPTAGAAAHSNSDSTRRTPPSSSSQAAGQAALGRLEGTGRSGSGGGKTHSPRAPLPQTSKHSTSATDPDSAYGVKSEKPSKGSEQATAAAQLLDTFAGSSMIINLVCPVCNRGVPHSEIHQHMNACLHEEYIREPLSASVQMIQSLCRDADRRTACVDTLCKYLDNITQYPDEEKYRKIRAGNKAFVDKVSGVVGADLFLEAVGFQQQLLPHQDSEQQFYVLPVEKATDGEWLEVSRELLSSSGPLRPTLDRNVSLYRPSSHVNQFDLSADFFQLSVDEIRREQKLKSEAMERDQVLRTKAVRERDDIRATVKYYRFTLLRIRLPDGLFLQAVFRPLEKLVEVRQMVSGVLTDHSLTFSLSAFGQLLKNDSDSLAQLGLVPSAVLNLSWTRTGPDSSQPYMEPGLLARIQQL